MICSKNVISKVALLQYYEKSWQNRTTRCGTKAWPERTVDISLTHTVHTSWIFEVASRHASMRSFVLGKSVIFEITFFLTNHRESQPI